MTPTADPLEMLRHYEAGKTEKEIGERLGVHRTTVKHHLDKYRDSGVIIGSHKSRQSNPVVVHWERLDERNTEVLPGERESLPAGKTDDIPDWVKETQLQRTTIPSSDQSTPKRIPEAVEETRRIVFDDDTAALLLVLAERELARRNDPVPRTGQKVPASYKLDTGTRDAIKAQAKKEGTSQGDLIDRAVRLYIGGK